MSPTLLTTALTAFTIDQSHLQSLLPVSKSTPNSEPSTTASTVELNGPMSYFFDVSLTLPAMPAFESPPAGSGLIEKDFGKYKRNTSWKGATFHDTESLELTVSSIPSSDSKEYVEFVHNVFRASHTPVMPVRRGLGGALVSGGRGSAPTSKASVSTPPPPASQHDK